MIILFIILSCGPCKPAEKLEPVSNKNIEPDELNGAGEVFLSESNAWFLWN